MKGWEHYAVHNWGIHIEATTIHPWSLFCRYSQRFIKHLGDERRFE